MFGEYAGFIVPSYIISFASLGITALVIWRTYLKRSAELDRMVSSQGRNEE